MLSSTYVLLESLAGNLIWQIGADGYYTGNIFNNRLGVVWK